MLKTTFCLLCCLSLLGTMAYGQSEKPTHTIGKFKTAPTLDGDLTEWAGFNPLTMSRPKVEDLIVDKAYVAWDDKYVYVAVSLHDKALVNANPIEKLQMGDCLDFRFARTTRDNVPNRLVIAPTSDQNKPGMMMVLPDKSQITDWTGTASNGVKWAVKAEGKVWSVEAAIPADVFDVKLKVDASFPFVFVVWDRDRADINEWAQWWSRSEFGNQKKQIHTWPLMILKEEAPVQQSALPTANDTAVASSTVKNQAAARTANLTLDVPRHQPCNLFGPNEKVSFTVLAGAGITGKGQLNATVNDYFGKTVLEKTLALELPNKEGVTLPFDHMQRGYYELNLKASLQDQNGKTVEGSQKVCFGVADITNRSASEVRQGGYRFGMKMFYIDKAWWAKNAQWDEREVVDAMCKLGMQWTRVLMQQTAHLATEEIVKAYPMNAIFKVERFPKELYDEQRYGPMNEFEAKYGRGSWVLKTLPQKEPYQAWLKEELKKLPAEQNVFEVWNEAWDKMSPEDLATVSNWIVEAILPERPDAIIGANLRGSTSKYEYDAKFIDAGGMKGMKMVALHPYSGSEDRLWLREYKQWISQRAGYPVDIYVTEYGSHSCPEGPAQRSEQEQAQRVVRQSLALYAEDVKAFTPHWVGQREQNPTYHEDWFGFIRLNHQPKPAMIAHAVSGRMIDASHYVGDLVYDPIVETMLFEHNGIYTMALWTKDGNKTIQVQPGVDELSMVNIVGTETKVKTTLGSLSLNVSPDLIYLVGVSPKLAEKASKELDPLRWVQHDQPKRITRTMPHASQRIVADGKLNEWDNALQIAMLNPKVNGDDASGMTRLTWDENNLYLAVEMRDNEILNKRSLNKLYQQDSVELFISTEPRDNNPGHGPNDHQFILTPTSAEGKPLSLYVTDRAAGKLAPIEGCAFYAGPIAKGWMMEAVIPWKQFPTFTPKQGDKIAIEIRVNDADTSHERWKIDPDGAIVLTEDPTQWSHLILGN